MKNINKTIILIVILAITSKVQSQSIPVIDSAKKTISYIMANKTKYIGKPMSVLFKDIKYPYNIPRPKLAGNHIGGISYFFKDEIWFDIQDTFPFYKLEFQFQNKFQINLDTLKNVDYIERTKRIKYMLRKQILVSIDSTSID
jgi:hypothetical protein